MIIKIKQICMILRGHEKCEKPLPLCVLCLLELYACSLPPGSCLLPPEPPSQGLLMVRLEVLLLVSQDPATHSRAIQWYCVS